MLKGKTIVLGVTGSIAAYKIANLASMLVKQHADVQVIMTENATNFINPITFETLTGNKCLVDTFDRNFQYSVEHVALAKKAAVFMVAPASANVIAKLAHGIADDMLTTTALACGGRGNNTGDFCSMIVAPAMNTNMFSNTVVRNNIAMLKELGYEIVEPLEGRLACGDTGKGKLPSEEELMAYILRAASHEKDLKDKKVLITAGATMEAIDPVRFITNHSTGKMGVALSEAAIRRGAKVTLVAGHMEVLPPYFADVVKVASAEEMYEEVTKRQADTDIIIKAAAVADYTPIEVATEKVKKSDGDMSIALKRTKDILGYLGEHKKDGQVIVGFSMETENMLENSKKKLAKKNADMIVANNLKTEGAGFGVDTNVVTIITKDDIKELPKMSKAEVANAVFDSVLDL